MDCIESVAIYPKFRRSDVKLIKVQFGKQIKQNKTKHLDKYTLLTNESDIHVITGALKLFFRELQQPVFPPSSHKDFLDAISEQHSLLSNIQQLQESKNQSSVVASSMTFSNVYHHNIISQLNISSLI